MNKLFFRVLLAACLQISTQTLLAGQIYWTDFNAHKISRANRDGTGSQTLINSGLQSPRDIEVDVSAGKMYWTDSVAKVIQRANLDGSNVQNLVTAGLDSPWSLALDSIHGKMYWTDSNAGTIKRANLDGTNVVTIVSSLVDPEGLDLDLIHGTLYWSDNGTHKVQRSTLSGGSIVDVLTTSLSSNTPQGIAVDPVHGAIYWAEYDQDRIRRADLNGANQTTIIQSPSIIAPTDLELDLNEGKIYWTAGDAKIQRANLDGSSLQNIISTGIVTTVGIGLDTVQLPEPSSLAILGSALATIGFYLRLPCRKRGYVPLLACQQRSAVTTTRAAI